MMPLNDHQLAAVTYPPTPLVIVAGAGSGKTAVMAERVAEHVSAHGVDAAHVLALTFSNHAAAQLRERIAERLGPGSSVEVRTYHGFGAALVREHHALLGYAEPPRLLDRAQAWQLCFDAFDEFRFQQRATGRPSNIVSDALALSDRCGDHLVAVEAVADDCAALLADDRCTAAVQRAARGRAELCQVVVAYERAKLANSLIDHGDQIRLAHRLCEEQPHVLAAVRRRHHAVLLDEYQDTNVAQRRLLQLLFPVGSPVTAVGDDLQSIYAFRGASVGNILAFERHFGGSATTLATCYRSGPQLIELAARLQDKVPRSRPRALRAAPGAAATRIECFLAADDREEALTIAADAAAECADGRSVAVLCRKRKQIPVIAEALAEAGVAVSVTGMGGLLVRPEVTDLVAWLEILGGSAAGADATIAALRILRGPQHRISLGDLAALARHARTLLPAGADPHGADLLDALDDLDHVADLSPQAWARCKQFVAQRDVLRAAAQRCSVADLLDEIARTTGLWELLDDTGSENVLRLIELADTFEPVARADGVAAFREYLQLRVDAEDEPSEATLPPPADAPAVRVMTVHQAKGLEFDVVFVPGLAGRGSSTYFPDARLPENPATQTAVLPWWLLEDDHGLSRAPRSGTDEQLARTIGRELRQEEEWRLLYVAITRARTRLVASAAHWYADTLNPQGPSSFYEFIRAQTDLVRVRFEHTAALASPGRAAMERRAARYRAEVLPPSDTEDEPVSLLDDPGAGGEPAAGAETRWPAPPSAVSTTGLVTFARCPRQFLWTSVVPLPRQRSAAAQFGTLVHSLIAQHASPQLALFDAPPVQADARALARRDAFAASVYGDLVPLRIEAPFRLLVGDLLVRGRVDVVYERDGRTELVDLKTGRPPAEGDPAAGVQLDVYGVAAAAQWRVPADRLRTTYCYVSDEGVELVSVDWDEARLDEVRAGLAGRADALSSTGYLPNSGPWCARCDFAEVCPATRATSGRKR